MDLLGHVSHLKEGLGSHLLPTLTSFLVSLSPCLPRKAVGSNIHVVCGSWDMFRMKGGCEDNKGDSAVTVRHWVVSQTLHILQTSKFKVAIDIFIIYYPTKKSEM